jgi:hypothetical protein
LFDAGVTNWLVHSWINWHGCVNYVTAAHGLVNPASRMHQSMRDSSRIDYANSAWSMVHSARPVGSILSVRRISSHGIGKIDEQFRWREE